MEFDNQRIFQGESNNNDQFKNLENDLRGGLIELTHDATMIKFLANDINYPIWKLHILYMVRA